MNHLCATYDQNLKGKERTRFWVGQDRINYQGEVVTPTTDILVAKFLFNCVISTKGDKNHNNRHIKRISCDCTKATNIHSNKPQRHSKGEYFEI